MKTTPTSELPSRYPFDAATQEIQRVLAWFPEGIYKRINIALGYSPDSRALTQRLGGINSKINFHQIGILANILGAPPFWPWIRWEDASALRDELKKLGKLALVKHLGPDAPSKA